MMGMMYGWGGKEAAGGWLGVNYVLGVVTWVAVIAVLVAATRYFWKKGR